MPLILLCGFPCSGKSGRATQLKSFFEHNGKKVFLISDSEIDKIESYANSQNEKAVRATMKADVEKYSSCFLLFFLQSIKLLLISSSF